MRGRSQGELQLDHRGGIKLGTRLRQQDDGPFYDHGQVQAANLRAGRTLLLSLFIISVTFAY